jgi:protein SCO1/2
MKPRWLPMGLLLWCAAGLVQAQALALPAAPQPAFDQHLGAQLPLQVEVVEDNGERKPLRQLFDRKPVVLVFGYYRCPNLCSTLMEGVLQTLAAIELPRAYRLVALSIDPGETSADAAAKEAAYRSLLPRADMHFLTASRNSIDRLASSAGFHYAYDASSKQYIHPSGFLVATPDGVISRYFLNVRFASAEVRQALDEATTGRVGDAVDQLLLACSHYDPRTGRYSGLVMTVVRAAFLALLALLAMLAGWLVLRRWRRLWRLQ